MPGGGRVLERAGTTTTLVSRGVQNGNGAAPAAAKGVSVDGSRVRLLDHRGARPGQTDTAADLYARAAGVTELVSGGTANDPAVFLDMSWDGGRVFFRTAERLAAADTDSQVDVYAVGSSAAPPPVEEPPVEEPPAEEPPAGNRPAPSRRHRRSRAGRSPTARRLRSGEHQGRRGRLRGIRRAGAREPQRLVALKVRCSGPAKCRGRIVLESASRAARLGRLAAKRFTAAAGHTVSVRVKLSRRGLRALTSARALKVKVTVQTFGDSDTLVSSLSRRIEVRAHKNTRCGRMVVERSRRAFPRGHWIRPATQLVGRERELAELQAALGAAREGRGRLYLIAGEPGIGKTRLAEVVADHGTAQGMHALWGRAWENAGAPAYWPWTQLLRAIVGTRDRPTLEAEFGPQCAGSGRCSPSSAIPRPRSAALRVRRRRASRCSSRRIVPPRRRGREPLVIVLDDIHAADPASLLLLEFIARGIPDASILVLATFQEAAAHRRPEVERLVGALGRASPSITSARFRGRRLAQRGRAADRAAMAAAPRRRPHARDHRREPVFHDRGAEARGRRRRRGGLHPAKRAGHPDFPLPGNGQGNGAPAGSSPLGEAAAEVLETAAVLGRESGFDHALQGARRGTAAGADRAGRPSGRSGARIRDMPGSIGRFRFTHNLIGKRFTAG